MDKLRKIGIWIWTNKERMILVIMLGFLCKQVYEVINPPPPAVGQVFMPPKDVIPDDQRPPQPPANPRFAAPGLYTDLYRVNPFWYHARKGGEQTTSRRVEHGLKLLAIQTVQGKNRARIETPGTRGRPKWYNEGESFEAYELVSIDAQAQTAEVFWSAENRTVTLTKQ